MDPADKKGCTLIRAYTLNRSNTVIEKIYYNFATIMLVCVGMCGM